MPKSLQLLRYCIVQLINVRNFLKPGEPIHQIRAEDLRSMLQALGETVAKLAELARLADKDPAIKPCSLFIKRLIVVIPVATSKLGSGIPFRERFEQYINDQNAQEDALTALEACILACQKCSTTLNSVLADSRFSPILRSFDLDK